MAALSKSAKRCPNSSCVKYANPELEAGAAVGKAQAEEVGALVHGEGELAADERDEFVVASVAHGLKGEVFGLCRSMGCDQNDTSVDIAGNGTGAKGLE